MTEMDDVLKDGLNSLKADRDRTKAAGTSKTALIPSHPDRSCVAGKDVLERAVLPSRSGAIPGSQMSAEWRATADEDGHYCLAIPL